MDDHPMDYADNLVQNQVAPGSAMNVEQDENLTETVIKGSKLDKGKAKVDYDDETLQNKFKDATSGLVNSNNQNTSNDGNDDVIIDDDDDDFDGCDTSDYGSDDFMYEEEEDDRYSAMQSEYFDNVDLPTGVEVSVPWLMDPASTQSNAASNKKLDLENKVKEASPSSSTTVQTEPSSSAPKEHENTEVLMQRVKDFKQFDTVEDFSDHHYSHMGFKEGAPPKEWAKKIQGEWKILEKNLPDTIFVRVYEARMELLRAVIMGPSGTPYHDGLFVFDCFFPPNYPAAPPTVYYYSGGLRLNPNLYDCGKVCLSLLGTWPGKQTEMWNPNQSTMLQVLVSIQALILNAKPFFNEPGYESYTGLAGKTRSDEYNENAFILSLKTMMYTVRRPPKHFEVLVAGHFRIRARDILLACKAYMGEALVGSVVVKDGAITNSEKSTSTSASFKAKLGKLMNVLVSNFAKNGSTNIEEFRSS